MFSVSAIVLCPKSSMTTPRALRRLGQSGIDSPAKAEWVGKVTEWNDACRATVTKYLVHRDWVLDKPLSSPASSGQSGWSTPDWVISLLHEVVVKTDRMGELQNQYAAQSISTAVPSSVHDG